MGQEERAEWDEWLRYHRERLRMMELELMMLDLDIMSASNQEEIEYIRYQQATLQERIRRVKEMLREAEAQMPA